MILFLIGRGHNKTNKIYSSEINAIISETGAAIAAALYITIGCILQDNYNTGIDMQLNTLNLVKNHLIYILHFGETRYF